MKQNALHNIAYDQLKSHLQQHWTLRRAFPADLVATGIPALDEQISGLPRGGITELYGDPSSGRTSLSLHWLARLTQGEEFCAYVDVCDALDPQAAQKMGVHLPHLLWVRCGGEAEHGLKAADLLLQNGGFSAIVLDIADLPVRTLQRFPLSIWHRFRLAVEGTRTLFLVLSQSPQTRSCATLALECRRERTKWTGLTADQSLLRRLHILIAPRRPVERLGVPLRLAMAE